MSALKKITSKAKILYKTGKYAKWTDAIKEASKSLHKTASTTVKKYGTKAKKYAVKKAKSGVKSLAKKVYESKYLAGAKKKPVKKTATKLHKDTKSHNVNIKVVSGIGKSSYEIYGNVSEDIKKAKNCILFAENHIERLKQYGDQPIAKKSIKMWKEYIKEYKTHINQLKKYI